MTNGTGQTFNCNDFSAPQKPAREFDGKANILHCKDSSQLAAANRNGSGTEFWFPVANEDFQSPRT
jgi:hypothetical protein